MSTAERRFFTEFSSLLDKRITIVTTDGKKLEGVLLGFHPDTLSICLGDARVYEDKGIIMVMDRVKVTEEGVEGTGPAAERVKKIYEQFVKETRG